MASTGLHLGWLRCGTAQMHVTVKLQAIALSVTAPSGPPHVGFENFVTVLIRAISVLI